MTARITLVRAESDGAERIELTAPLDADGRFDAKVTPGSWEASRHVGDAPPLGGTLRHDEDGGWSLRFSEQPGDPDAPLACLLPGDGPVGMGGYVSIREPDGQIRPWQIVNLT